MIKTSVFICFIGCLCRKSNAEEYGYEKATNSVCVIDFLTFHLIQKWSFPSELEIRKSQQIPPNKSFTFDSR